MVSGAAAAAPAPAAGVAAAGPADAAAAAHTAPHHRQPFKGELFAYGGLSCVIAGARWPPSSQRSEDGRQGPAQMRRTRLRVPLHIGALRPDHPAPAAPGAQPPFLSRVHQPSGRRQDAAADTGRARKARAACRSGQRSGQRGGQRARAAQAGHGTHAGGAGAGRGAGRAVAWRGAEHAARGKLFHDPLWRVRPHQVRGMR
jgi:hypothetical protein